MEKFSPEFNALWHTGQDARATADVEAKENKVPSPQEVALEELAERVNAARSIA